MMVSPPSFHSADDHVKTDRHDSERLASLARAGELGRRKALGRSARMRA
jgi:hypothetical protein